MRSAIGTVGGMVQMKGKSIALQQLDCVAHTMHQCAVFWVSYFAGNAEALDRWGGKNKTSYDFILSQ